jgi:tetratricopeptide (TPR) repeat protein
MAVEQKTDTGHFTSHYLAEVLRNIFLQEQTGTLRLTSSTGPMNSFEFDRGMLVDADSPSGAAMLAAALRDAGLVSAEILLETVPDCATATDLARALLKRGVETRLLVPGVKGLIRRALTDAFAWQGGTFIFEAKRSEGKLFKPDVLFTFESILGGIEVMSNFEPLRQVLVEIPGRLRMSENQFMPVHRLTLRPHHGFVLSRFDGTITMRELFQIVPQDAADDALKFTYGLLVFGVVSLDPPLGEGAFHLRRIMSTHHEERARIEKEVRMIRETLDRISGQDPAELLGTAASATAQEIRASYEELRSRFKRERLSESVQESMKKELDLLDARLTEAYFKLEIGSLEQTQREAREGAGVTSISKDDLVKRREFSKTERQATQEQNIRLAEKYHAKAREHFREGDYHNCIQFCRLAIRFNIESAEAYHLMGDALSLNPDRRWQRQAEEAYRRATDLEPFRAEYWVTLGLFYKERRLDSRAKVMFEKAVEILPTHPIATKELKALRKR